MLVSAAPLLANSFKEMKMSRRRIKGTFFALFFFAAVAVFPNVMQAPTSTKATHKAIAGEFRSTGALIADGGDPVPKPIPWPKQLG